MSAAAPKLVEQRPVRRVKLQRRHLLDAARGRRERLEHRAAVARQAVAPRVVGVQQTSADQLGQAIAQDARRHAIAALLQLAEAEAVLAQLDGVLSTFTGEGDRITDITLMIRPWAALKAGIMNIKKVSCARARGLPRCAPAVRSARHLLSRHR
jgi:hypothetical protein